MMDKRLTLESLRVDDEGLEDVAFQLSNIADDINEGGDESDVRNLLAAISATNKALQEVRRMIQRISDSLTLRFRHRITHIIQME